MFDSNPNKKMRQPEQTTREQFHHGDLAQDALVRSLEYVEQFGHESLSLRNIATRCGVNHRALYRHYKDKDALVLRVAREGFILLTDQCYQASNNLKPPAAFGALMQAYVLFAFARPRLYGLMFSLPLKEEFRKKSATGAVIKKLISVSLMASRLATDTDVCSRDRVIYAWAKAHGLICLFKAGVLNFRSDKEALKYLLASL
jgi:AcrR family transcriptional regulator